MKKMKKKVYVKTIKNSKVNLKSYNLSPSFPTSYQFLAEFANC